MLIPLILHDGVVLPAVSSHDSSLTISLPYIHLLLSLFTSPISDLARCTAYC